MAQDSGQPPRQGHAKVRLNFGNATTPVKVAVAVPGRDEEGGAMVMVIALGAVTVVLFLLCSFLLIYLCQRWVCCLRISRIGGFVGLFSASIVYLCSKEFRVQAIVSVNLFAMAKKLRTSLQIFLT